MINYSVFKVKFGSCGVVCGDKGVLRLIMSSGDKNSVFPAIRKSFPYATKNTAKLKNITRSIKSYFDGSRKELDFPVDLGTATRFEKAVYRALRKIPYSRTITYGKLARNAGVSKAARAVGNALAKNPVALVVPCHRVVRGDGMGGFSARGGSALKRRLLDLESKNK